MIRKFLHCTALLPVILFFALSASAKNNAGNDTLSFTALLHEMQDDGKKEIKSAVRYAEEIDRARKDGMDSIYLKGKPSLAFNGYHTTLKSVDFDEEYWLVLNNAVFNCHLSFLNCTNIKAIFKNCVFNKQVRLNGNNIDFIRFDSCVFKNGIKATRNSLNEHITFNDCVVMLDSFGKGDGFDMQDRIFNITNNIGGDLVINHCYFKRRNDCKKIPRNHFKDLINFPCVISSNLLVSKYNYSVASDSLKRKMDSLAKRSKLLSEKIQPFDYFIDFSHSRFKNLVIKNSACNTTLLFYKTIVEGQLYLYGTTADNVIMDGISINTNNSQLDWNEINNERIYVIDNRDSFLVNGNRITDLYNRNLFAGMMSAYSTVYRAYKEQDNKSYANLCYVEWKDVETKYFKYKSEHDTLSTERSKARINYYLNYFFSFFCDYGTNPLKALSFCIAVILLFALFYTFLPIDIKYATSDLKANLLIYVEFVLSRHNRVESFSRLIKPDVEPAEVRPPTFFNSIGSRLRFLNITGRLEKQTERIYDNYNRKPGAKDNIRYHIQFYTSFVFSLLTLFILKYIDSIFLSMNVFTTLGFGELKVKGSAIYLTVLEGFIGWFLLGIFSVCILNQVIT